MPTLKSKQPEPSGFGLKKLVRYPRGFLAYDVTWDGVSLGVVYRTSKDSAWFTDLVTEKGYVNFCGTRELLAGVKAVLRHAKKDDSVQLPEAVRKAIGE